MPVASRGVGESSVWNVNVFGRLHADAATTDRNIVYRSGLDIVLCEVCNAPSLVSAPRAASCYLRRPEDDEECADG